MLKLLHIMFLSCWQATYFSSIRSFKKIGLVRRIQLWLHLHMCKDCHEFDHQSELIDTSLSHLYSSSIYNSDNYLATDKKEKMKATVNQHLN